MNKRELMEEIRAHGAWCRECHDISGKKDVYVKTSKVRELIEQLEEPVSEKIEVPDFVGKWIDYCDAQEFSLHAAMNWHSDLPAFLADIYLDFRDWLTDENYEEHEEIFARAWLDGFTVESKRWVVKDRKGECVYELRLAYTDTTMVNTNKTGIDGLVFTDRAKAEAVAVLVEGSVEEV